MNRERPVLAGVVVAAALLVGFQLWIVPNLESETGAVASPSSRQAADESIDPETNPQGDYTAGRLSTTVDGTTFSFATAMGGWEMYPQQGAAPGSTLISRHIRGSQGAEEVICWAAYPQSSTASPCGALRDPGQPPSAHGVASLVSTAPGIDLVTGPEDVTVGGHPAVHVVVTVREALGCDPGYFFSWEPQQGGRMWTGTGAGDTILVWVVEVDGGRFFIGGETTTDWHEAPFLDASRGLWGTPDEGVAAGSAVPDGAVAGLAEEIQEIVDSIEFEQ